MFLKNWFYLNIGPTLPVHIAYHCLTMVGDSTIMMIGGYIDEDGGFSERTFTIDFDALDEGVWTDGPPMKNYRGYLGKKCKNVHFCSKAPAFA